MRLSLLLISAVLLPWLGAAANATECSAHSGPQATPLLELYTSEGCSSCPPADQWLSSLKASASATQVVPLAFHVDYWDYIGWRDQFAQAAFSERQRAGAGLLGFVYTPQVKLNGKDFRGWQREAGWQQLLEQSRARPARAELALRLAEHGDSLSVYARLLQPPGTGAADVYLAFYENGLKSQVKAGENNGRLLRHDYVVRELLGPFRLDAQPDPAAKTNEGGSGALQRSFAVKPRWQSRNAGAALFVQDRNSGEVLQALSLPFCG